MSDFQPVYAAAITPRGPKGDLNFGAMFELIDYLCAARTPGIMLFDGAGEYPAYAAEERSRVTRLAVKRSRAPVLVGVGSPALDISVMLAREARDAGAAGVVVPPPLFFNGDSADLMEFYRQFAAETAPGVPAVITSFSQSIKLVEDGLFAGMLDCSEDFQLAGLPPSRILTGNDEMLRRALSAGAGAISPAACALPELTAALARAISASDAPQIERLASALSEFLAWSRQFPSPVAVKVAASVRGVKTGPLLAPLAPEKCALLERFREWFRSWLPAMKAITAHG